MMKNNHNKKILANQTGYTENIPSEYFKEANHKGKITKIKYPSKDYLRGNRSITKEAYVYTPYGYNDNDINKKYNIIYLMHGWTMTTEHYIFKCDIINVLDNMIEKKLIEPLILVSATFDADNKPQDFGLSVKELRVFHNDFRENLIYAVEKKYNTYSNRSKNIQDYINSREHRAFGGFSLGSVTTWHQFVFNNDIIKYYLPMSGSCWFFGGYADYYPKETCDFFEKMIKEKNLNQKGYFIYATTGTYDGIKHQMDTQMEEMLKRNHFFTKEKVFYYMKKNGCHDLEAVEEYLYNALPLFFND
jgi:endo-1,4-beta-xylanase